MFDGWLSGGGSGRYIAATRARARGIWLATTLVLPPPLGGQCLRAWVRFVQGLRVRGWRQFTRLLVWLHHGRFLRARGPVVAAPRELWQSVTFARLP